jgi:TPR repeat protein
MKKKFFLTSSLLFIVVILFFCLKFYTKTIYNSAIEECESKYNSNYSRKFLEEQNGKNSKVKPTIKSILINRFDKQSYDSIVRTDSPEKSLIYSLIVSNRWNHTEASLEVFYSIANLNEDNKFVDFPDLDFLDSETRNLALKYLKKASDKKNPNALFILGNYYLKGKYLEKNEALGKKLMKEAEIVGTGVLK